MKIKPKRSVQGLPVYQPGKPLEVVKKELGLESVIKLASNENPFGCSPKIWERLAEEKDQFHLYPDGNMVEIREALAEHLEVDPRRLIFGNGSDEIVQIICRAYLEPGTESVLADPTFPRYETGIAIEGATAVKVPLKDGVHDLDGMLDKINEKTRIVWICNPNNPTGTIVGKEALERFLEQVPEHVLVVLDEAYYEYVVDPSYPDSMSLLDYNPQIIILRTFSKIYGLAAFRIGYGIAHPDVIQELNRARDPFNVNRLAQKAALAALEDQSYIFYCRSQNRIGMKQIEEKLEEWGLSYFPSQGNFILLDTGRSGRDAFEYLLKKGIIVRNGEAIGYPTHIRVTIGTQEQNERFLQMMSEYLAEKGMIQTHG